MKTAVSYLGNDSKKYSSSLSRQLSEINEIKNKTGLQINFKVRKHCFVCSVIGHRRRQNVARTSMTHSAIASCVTFLFLPHFDVICDLLLNRYTATWNPFVKPQISQWDCEISRNCGETINNNLKSVRNAKTWREPYGRSRPKAPTYRCFFKTLTAGGNDKNKLNVKEIGGHRTRFEDKAYHRP